MKVALVNTSDAVGGAAIAARRLSAALNSIGTEAKLLVRQKKQDSSIGLSGSGLMDLYRTVVDQAAFSLKEASKDVRFAFSVARMGQDISRNKHITEADVIHLHWINKGFLSIRNIESILSLGKPVVWTLHDMWAFTGGCHYSGSCTNYQQECGSCYFLKNPGPDDLSHNIWKRKAEAYRHGKLAFVTCSKWLRSIALESKLLGEMRVESIPNPIDTQLYQPILKEKARQTLGLPMDKKLMLFGAMNVADKRKGFTYLEQALKTLVSEHPEVVGKLELVVFGKFKVEPQLIKEIPVHFLGSMHSEEQIVATYNAADLFVLPSLEDNLPNTVMESLSCGTPVVAFDIGGLPQMVDHQQNGYLAGEKNASELAQGILWILRNENGVNLSGNARNKVEANYGFEVIAKRYTALYNDLLNTANAGA